MVDISKDLKFLSDLQVNLRNDVFTINKIYIDIYKHITTLCSAIIVILVGFIGHYGPKQMTDRECLIFGIIGFGVCIVLGVHGMYSASNTLCKISGLTYDMQTWVNEAEEYFILANDVVKKAEDINISQDEPSKKAERLTSLAKTLEEKQMYLDKAKLVLHQDTQIAVKYERSNNRTEAFLFGIFVGSILFILWFIVVNI